QHRAQQDRQQQLISLLTLFQQWALGAALLALVWQGWPLLDAGAVSVPILLAAVLALLGLSEALLPLAGSFVALGLSQTARDRVNAIVGHDPAAEPRVRPRPVAPFSMRWERLGVRWPGAINGATGLSLAQIG